jgi:SAM-dependent methyltransferase
MLFLSTKRRATNLSRTVRLRKMILKLSSEELIRSTLAYYDAHAEEFVERTAPIDLSAAYEPFLALLPPGAHILDAGCGSGRDTREFLAKGFKVTAFDGSKRLADIAKATTGQSVLHLRFDQITFDGEFDAVWACASLLHLPDDVIEDALDRLIFALSPGGVLFMSFKMGSGAVTDNGRYTSLMSDDRLAALLNSRRDRLMLVRKWTSDDTQGRPLLWTNVLARRVTH